MGQRGPTPLPGNVHLLRNDPSKLGRSKLAALLDEKVRPPVEIPEWPADLVPQVSALVLPAGIRSERAAGGEVAAEAKREWDRITPHLVRLGLISQLDRAVVVMYCFWWAIGQRAKQKLLELGDEGLIDITPSGYKQMGVWLQVASKADGEVKSLLAQVGLSPAARTRVTPGDPQASLPGIDAPTEGGWGMFPDPQSQG